MKIVIPLQELGTVIALGLQHPDSPFLIMDSGSLQEVSFNSQKQEVIVSIEYRISMRDSTSDAMSFGSALQNGEPIEETEGD